MRRSSRVVKSVPASVPPPAPSLDLFARFQHRSGDFSGRWLMLEEAAPPGAPLIAQSVADKLREQHDTMRRLRDADDAAKRGNDEEGQRGEKDAQLSGEEEKESLDSSVEYVPGDVVAEDVPPPVSGESMQGDFLNFVPHLGDGAAVASSELQVTLLVSPGNVPSQQGCPSFRLPRQSGDSQAESDTHPPLFKTRPNQQQIVVPLWCVDRFKRLGGYSSNLLVMLHQEVCDLIDFLRPSQAEVSMRRMIEMEIGEIARRLWPECEPVVYGSMTTHLLLPLSDLDMTILNVPCSTEDALKILAGEISKAGLCHAAYPQVIIKTKVPLVKFQHRLSLLDVDISINAVDGPRNSSIIVDLLEKFPESRPLTILVKYFLHQRGMDEPYHGGLGSFATTLLVISFLQQHPIYRNCPEERAYSGLGRLLVDFFRYYGTCFNYNCCGISVHDGGRYFRRTHSGSTSAQSPTSPRSMTGPAQVLIEDPGCPTNNAASSLRSFQAIVSVFQHAYMALTAIFEPCAPESCSPDATDIRRRPTLLSRILHVDAESVRRRQNIVAGYELLLNDPAQQERMSAAQAYRREEDLPMLKSVPRRKRSHSEMEKIDCKEDIGIGVGNELESDDDNSSYSEKSTRSRSYASENSASNGSSVRLVA